MLSKRDRARLDIASKLAEFSTCKQRHGAVVFRGGRLLGMGFNKSHVNNQWLEGHEFPSTTHAEVAALKHLSDDVVRGSTVYVSRILKNGDEAISRPCNKCAMYLIERGVKSVVFTV